MHSSKKISTEKSRYGPIQWHSKRCFRKTGSRQLRGELAECMVRRVNAREKLLDEGLRQIAPHAAMNDKDPSPWHIAPSMTAFASLLVCGSLRRFRRKITRCQLLVVALLTTAGMTLIGCGGANGSGGSSTSPPPPVSANYTVTLTGTDSVIASIRASTTFTLTVN